MCGYGGFTVLLHVLSRRFCLRGKGGEVVVGDFVIPFFFSRLFFAGVAAGVILSVRFTLAYPLDAGLY